ncbi:uncharacterized protein LOC142620397 [Castanea sativa]|uniref:uncharacterized protein LOC142620397 n=1 Tax=Castanea sativa TaxID=21020 RepID=UPI003F64A1B2
MGDFNETLHHDEYWGNGSHPMTQIVEFQRVVDDCSLLDLGFKENKVFRVALLHWGGGNVRDLFKSIATKKKLLSSLEKECHDNPSNFSRIQLRNATKAKLNELIYQEEVYWHQRAKVSWLQSGNRNNKFFHGVASQRRRGNVISMLKDSNGTLVSQQSDLEAVATQYFQDIFTSTSFNSLQQVIQHVDKVVTTEMNNSLLEDFSDDEVRTTLF